MRTNLIAAAAILGGAILAGAAPANATLMMSIGGTTITDGGAGDLAAPAGLIIAIGTADGFTYSANTGSSSSLPSIDLGSTTLTSSGSGSIVIQLTQTNLASPAGIASWLSQFSGNWTNGAATVSLSTYYDASNTAFGTATSLASLTSGSTPFSLTSSNLGANGALFSITEVMTIKATAANQTFSLDGSLTAVPEPMSLGLLGVGLASLGLVGRRKKAV